jgi:hypothetical protein
VNNGTYVWNSVEKKSELSDSYILSVNLTITPNVPVDTYPFSPVLKNGVELYEFIITVGSGACSNFISFAFEYQADDSKENVCFFSVSDVDSILTLTNCSFRTTGTGIYEMNFIQTHGIVTLINFTAANITTVNSLFLYTYASTVSNFTSTDCVFRNISGPSVGMDWL